MIRSFTIAAATGAGRRRWWIVRIHPSLEALWAAARAYHPGVDLDGCHGCCHAYAWQHPDGRVEHGPGGYAGIIRLAVTHLNPEIIAHELVHAALAIYRMDIAGDVRLGRTVGEREEQLAYIYGELYADMHLNLCL